ncbi:MAG TPA: GNAT family N-acetyltransferase [Spirochaetia bacterium]|nr:GNAT family N-acetyltransferase [Spirochaetia bacterium]
MGLDASDLLIRIAELSDVPRIAEIYNQAVVRTVATFDTVEKTLEEMTDWFNHHGNRHPATVAVVQRNVAGWASLSQWSDRCAYELTCEASIYVDEEYRGKGIGGRLFEDLIVRARAIGMHTILSRIAGGNQISRKMHIDRGFVHLGTMREVGLKFGQLLDVDLYQMIFENPGK